MKLRDILAAIRFHWRLSRLPLNITHAIRVDYVNRSAILPYPSETEADMWMKIAARSYAVVSSQLWVRGKWPWIWSLHSFYLNDSKNEALLGA